MTKRNPTTLEKVKCLTDFATDGCTMSPDLVFSECCVVHDIDYATGEVTREEADYKLQRCIRSKGFPVLCWIYWLGVRLYGWVPYYFGHNYKLRIEYAAKHNSGEDC